MRSFGTINMVALLWVILVGCSSANSPFDVTITGATTFETRFVTFGPNENNDYGVLALFDVNIDATRPTRVANFTIYGLQSNGARDYELSETPGGSTTPVVTFSFITQDMDGSFSYKPNGRFTVTEFDGTKMSCTFDFVVEDESGKQLHVRGTLTDIPFNDELFSG